MSITESVSIPSSLDRKVAIAMITSDKFLSKVRGSFSEKYITTDYARTVCRWCVEYWDTYKRAPGADIKTVFETKRLASPRRSTEFEVIEKLLTSISNENDRVSLNIDYLIDTVKECWARENYRILAEQLQDSQSVGDARRAVREFTDIQTVTNEPTQVLKDASVADELFKEENEQLITFRGALGELVGPWMTRDQLICVIAPAKGGKTALLTEIASKCINSRRNIAFFQCGDLSTRQFYSRLFSSLAEKPVAEHFSKQTVVPCIDCFKHCQGSCAKMPSRPVVAEISQEVLDDDAGLISCCDKIGTCKDYTPFLSKKVTQQCDCLTEDDVKNCQKRLTEYMEPAQFLSLVVPNSTLTVDAIDGCLKSWRDDYGFIPDVVLIDYADILAPERGSGADERDRQNLRWKKLRRLSQEWHCLVVAPTQSNRDGFDKELLNSKNLSEDIRKLAHATGVLAIHQTARERRAGVSRVSWILGRDGQPDNSVQVIVCNDMAVGRWGVQSCFRYAGYSPKSKEAK